MVSIDIPKGATTDPVHGAITTIDDFSAFGAIAGFHIAGGFTFTLTRGDGSTTPVTLLEPANATLTIPSTTPQVILCEVLNDTPFGTIVRLAALTDRSTDTIFTTKAIDRAALPLDGIVRGGTYLVLTADSPIAFAFGQVRLNSGGTTLASALVVPELGVADISRIGGVFVVPVPARPAAPFSLRARSVTARRRRMRALPIPARSFHSAISSSRSSRRTSSPLRLTTVRFSILERRSWCKRRSTLRSMHLQSPAP
jgi:hypothetical protein